MSPEADYIEPEYETPAAEAAAGCSLTRRVSQIIFYGGSAAALGLMLLVYASPTFAARVGNAVPSSLMSFAAGSPSGGDCAMSHLDEGSPCHAASAADMARYEAELAATQRASSCCSSLSRASMVAAASEPAECGETCPSEEGEEVTELATADAEIPDATEVFADGL